MLCFCFVLLYVRIVVRRITTPHRARLLQRYQMLSKLRVA